MIQRLLLTLVGLWLFPLFSLFAQVGFSLPVLNNVEPGAVVTMPVKVYNFDSIVGTQFVITWDTQVLHFSGVLFYNLPGMSNEDFGLVDVENGLLRFAWEAPSPTNGYTAPDGSSIFRIKFAVVGSNDQGSAVVITEDPPTTIFEVVQVGVPAIILGLEDCSIANGYVAVGFVLSTNQFDGQATLPVTISPNPFTKITTATFDLDNSTELQMVLTDAAGHTVLEKKMSLSAGRHGMEIASDQLQENGIYYLILRTDTQSCIRTLVKL